MEIISSSESDRGSSICRACNSGDLRLVLDLGQSPIANSLPRADSPVDEKTYPLRLYTCGSCQLGQIAEFETPEKIFGSYPYLSSTSQYWVDHARSFVESTIEKYPSVSQGYVLELASNDGYLLQHFKEKFVKVLGVDPARNVAEIANSRGIPTLPEFFGVNLAREILSKYGSPSLIVANNVAAHVPDMRDFFEGIALLAAPETLISIENPSLGYLLEKGFYDTVYHEHYSYLSVNSVAKIATAFGMNLFAVEDLPTHGGSLRYWLTSNPLRETESSVEEEASKEFERGVGQVSREREFKLSVDAEISKIANWVLEQQDCSIIGYGAAAKTVTTFFAANLDHSKFEMIVDANKLKQNNRLPGTTILINGLEKLTNTKAKKVLIFPWNLEEEIAKSIRDINPSLEIWSLNPLHRVEI